MVKMIEKFKPIKDYEGLYEVSNFGNVKSLARKTSNQYDKVETILKPCSDKRGYLHISLYKNRKQETHKIAHLVYDHFGKGKRDGHSIHIDHVDNNKINNRIDNLQLLTSRANTSKGWGIKKTTSKFIGVDWHKQKEKWRARIQINGKDLSLGHFTNEFNAHLAYQKALEGVF
jgi:hypothetical protein